MKAYTYLIKHKNTGMVYYGCRKSETFDLFVNYFTSSKLVKRAIEEEGLDVFEYEIRKQFESYEKAREWECKVLRKMNVANNAMFYNQAVSSPKLCKKDSKQEQIRRDHISVSMKKLWENKEYSNYHKQLLKSFCKSGNEKRSFLYKTGAIKRKPRRKSKTSDYKIITIRRKDSLKEIHQNQLCAYKKCGWVLVS